MSLWDMGRNYDWIDKLEMPIMVMQRPVFVQKPVCWLHLMNMDGIRIKFLYTNIFDI